LQSSFASFVALAQPSLACNVQGEFHYRRAAYIVSTGLGCDLIILMTHRRESVAGAARMGGCMPRTSRTPAPVEGEARGECALTTPIVCEPRSRCNRAHGALLTGTVRANPFHTRCASR